MCINCFPVTKGKSQKKDTVFKNFLLYSLRNLVKLKISVIFHLIHVPDLCAINFINLKNNN